MTDLFWNLKGGVGKTFAATHLFQWALAKRPLCFFDADEQNTGLKWLSGNRYAGEPGLRVQPEEGHEGLATADPARAARAEDLVIDGAPRSDFLDALSEEIDLASGWRAVVPVGERYGLEGAREAVQKVRNHGGQPLLLVNGPDLTTRIGRRTVAQARGLADRLGAELHRRVIPFSKVVRQAADKGAPAWEMGWARNSRAILALNLLCHELYFGEAADGSEYGYTQHQQQQVDTLRIDRVLA